jgi:hypothetical protein
MEWLQTHWKDVVDIVTYIIAAASVIVRLTPTPKDNAALDKVVKFLEMIALNKK